MNNSSIFPTKQSYDVYGAKGSGLPLHTSPTSRAGREANDTLSEEEAGTTGDAQGQDICCLFPSSEP